MPACRSNLLALNFNSIKVRLEHPAAKELLLPDYHFNSIKVRLEPIIIIASLMSFRFQFHKGAIRTMTEDMNSQHFLHFNSIKVRLEPTHTDNLHIAGFDFNSIKVRLEPNPSSTDRTIFSISIP